MRKRRKGGKIGKGEDGEGGGRRNTDRMGEGRGRRDRAIKSAGIRRYIVWGGVSGGSGAWRGEELGGEEIGVG